MLNLNATRNAPPLLMAEVLLRAGESLPYTHVLRAIAEIKGAGVENTHLAYDEKRGKGPLANSTFSLLPTRACG